MTVRELLDRYTAALGGIAAVEAAAVHEVVTEIAGAMPQLLRELVDERRMRRRLEVRIPTLGQTMIEGFDGELAWSSSPMFDGWHPASHPETRRERGNLMPLWRRDLPTTGPGAPRLAGTTLDERGRRCWVVEREQLNEADQLVPVRELIDAETFLLSEVRFGADDLRVQTVDDHREVAGRLFPFRLTQRQPEGRSILAVQSVEIASPPDAAFAHPTATRPAPGSEDLPPDLAAFDTVWSTVRDIHFDPAFGGSDWDEVGRRYRPEVQALDGAGGVPFVAIVTRMIRELGASHYVVRPRDQVHSGEERARNPGWLGVTLQWVEDRAVVYDIVPDSPTSRSPLRRGFVVTAIGGRDRAALEAEHADVVSHTTNPDRQALAPFQLALRLAAEETVEIGYLDAEDRPGSWLAVAAPRPLHHDPRFSVTRRDDVVVIAFRLFVGDVAERAAAALRDARDAAGVVYDLRCNPGGVAQIPALLAAELVRGTADLGRFSFRSETTTLGAPGVPEPYDGPVAVLVDSGSGSCSEVFAGALQEQGRVRVFGRPTAGGVLPSRTTLLANGCEFQYAACDYHTPAGTRLEGRGVRPDQEVPLLRADLLSGRDPDLAAAIDWIRASG